jgi:large subunit ribosomal protein L5
MKNVKEKNNTAFESLKTAFKYTNKMQAPRIEKVVISSGVGSLKDKKKIDLVEDRLKKITGQKPVRKGAKVSIAAFKVREGDPVGFQATLRGKRMYDFLDKLLTIALPRTKDFRGISVRAIDSMGNYTLGIKEHSIFPETTDEELKDIFGLSATIVTTAKNKDEAKAFFDHIGLPFKKKEEEKKEKSPKVKKVKKEKSA